MQRGNTVTEKTLLSPYLSIPRTNQPFMQLKYNQTRNPPRISVLYYCATHVWLLLSVPHTILNRPDTTNPRFHFHGQKFIYFPSLLPPSSLYIFLPVSSLYTNTVQSIHELLLLTTNSPRRYPAFSASSWKCSTFFPAISLLRPLWAYPFSHISLLRIYTYIYKNIHTNTRASLVCKLGFHSSESRKHFSNWLIRWSRERLWTS